METQSLSLDRINTLPENIIETILSFIPIRDALRTSILSKKWRYSWRNMPKLVCTDDMIKVPCDCIDLEKYKIVNAILHVLLFHNGPTVVKFNCSVGELKMDSEFSHIMSYLARVNKVRELIFFSDYFSYKIPISFFSLQGLERIDLLDCKFEPPLTFNGFSRLKSMKFTDVEISSQMLLLFLSKCPLLEHICLSGCEDVINYVEEGNEFTVVDLLQCVPFIRSFDLSQYYMKYYSADGMPHQLPTLLVHLKHLSLEVCLMEQNQVFSALCMIRSSPLLVKINISIYGNEPNDKLHVQQTPTNFLDPDDYPDLNLVHLEILEIDWFSNFYLEMKFVKLFLVKSPVLKKVTIELNSYVTVDKEVKMLRDLVRLPLPRASPSAELIIKR